MKKQALHHVHGLLHITRGFLEEQKDIEIDAEEYDALGVTPTDIHTSKTDQKEAIFKLVHSIGTAVGETGPSRKTAVRETEPSRNYLNFSEEDVHEGKLVPTPEADPYLMKTIANIAEVNPGRVRPYLPFTICFLANGNYDSQRAALRTIDIYIDRSDVDLSDIIPSLRRVAESTDDRELKSELYERTENTFEND